MTFRNNADTDAETCYIQSQLPFGLSAFRHGAGGVQGGHGERSHVSIAFRLDGFSKPAGRQAVHPHPVPGVSIAFRRLVRLTHGEIPWLLA